MMSQIIQPVLMKKTTKTKTKKKLLSNKKQSKVFKKIKKPKISISIISKKDIKKKEKSTKVKPTKDIVVPRIKETPKTKSVELESDEVTLVDENEPKKRRRGRNKKEKIYFSKATEEAIMKYQGIIGVYPTDGVWGQETENKMPPKEKEYLDKMVSKYESWW